LAFVCSFDEAKTAFLKLGGEADGQPGGVLQLMAVDWALHHGLEVKNGLKVRLCRRPLSQLAVRRAGDPDHHQQAVREIVANTTMGIVTQVERA
jgi:hypothetical protein